MKKILFLAAIICCTAARAQNFEGIIKWSMNVEMKMQGGPDMSSMMPKSMEVHIKDQNSLTKMEGGMMSGMEMLFLKAKNETYRIDRASKSYSPLPSGSMAKNPTDNESKVTKTSETMKILDYTCTKYIVETKTHGQTMQHVIWATNEIKGIDIKSFGQQRGPNAPSFSFDKIDGVPLKIETAMPQMKMTMEVTEIKKQSLPASDFTIPSGYTEVKSAFPAMPH